MNHETNSAKEPIQRQFPDFIKLLETVSGNPMEVGDETASATPQLGPSSNPNRKSANASGLVQGIDPRGNQTASDRERPADGSQDGRSGDPSGVGALQKLDPVALAHGLGAVAPEDTFEGQEHQVYHDIASGMAVKLTQPAAFGARGSVSGYLSQMKLINDIFGDQVVVDGTVQIRGEAGPRLVSTQPWVAGTESTLEEIDTYMRRKGFLRMFDGAWWNPATEIQVTDALPKNFITDRFRHVHPIDLIIAWPSARAQERIEDMMNAQPQPDAPPEPAGPL